MKTYSKSIFDEILKWLPTFLIVHTYFDVYVARNLCPKDFVSRKYYLFNLETFCQVFYESSIFIKTFPGSFSFDKVINFYFYAKHLITNQPDTFPNKEVPVLTK